MDEEAGSGLSLLLDKGVLGIMLVLAIAIGWRVAKKLLDMMNAQLITMSSQAADCKAALAEQARLNADLHASMGAEIKSANVKLDTLIRKP